jgi:hypothetical protein
MTLKNHMIRLAAWLTNNGEDGMKRNLGSTDKALRLVIGLSLTALAVYYGNILWIIGVPVAVTGVIGWCPVYALFGKSTHKKE